MTPNMATIRLLVVDDHSLFRRGLIALLSNNPTFAIVGEAADASAALTATAKLQPDLILLDNHLPGVNGIDAIADMKAASPNSRVIMLTVSENEQDLAAGLKAGADGYLLKTINTEDLCDSIIRVWEGDSVISPEMMGKLVGLLRDTQDLSATATEKERAHALSPDDPIHLLSPREREILALVANGDSNKLIARALDIAETTVKLHVQHILRKLNVSNRVHAAVYARERHLA
jgi:two-component system nitrate/nitrite response regulator NarL